MGRTRNVDRTNKGFMLYNDSIRDYSKLNVNQKAKLLDSLYEFSIECENLRSTDKAEIRAMQMDIIDSIAERLSNDPEHVATSFVFSRIAEQSALTMENQVIKGYKTSISRRVGTIKEHARALGREKEILNWQKVHGEDSLNIYAERIVNGELVEEVVKELLNVITSTMSKKTAEEPPKVEHVGDDNKKIEHVGDNKSIKEMLQPYELNNIVITYKEWNKLFEEVDKEGNLEDIKEPFKYVNEFAIKHGYRQLGL